MSKRIPESELILPTLFILTLQPNNTISISSLIIALTKILNPSGEDAEILDDRRDTKFSQKVRNLVSHNTLEKFGFASYKKITNQGYLTITHKGLKYLDFNINTIKYLLQNNFCWDDLRISFKKINSENFKGKKIDDFDENLVISEGSKHLIETHVYKRSSTLRDYAIKFYKHSDGRIICNACDFDFNQAYPKVGDSFIEMHHIKPIFKLHDENIIKFLKDAVKDVIPVCSNCHRMIHRNRKYPLEINALKKLINVHYTYS